MGRRSMKNKICLNQCFDLMGIEKNLLRKYDCSFQNRSFQELESQKSIYTLACEETIESKYIKEILTVKMLGNRLSIHHTRLDSIQFGVEYRNYRRDTIGEFTFEEAKVILVLGEREQMQIGREINEGILDIESILDIDGKNVQVKTYVVDELGIPRTEKARQLKK